MYYPVAGTERLGDFLFAEITQWRSSYRKRTSRKIIFCEDFFRLISLPWILLFRMTKEQYFGKVRQQKLVDSLILLHYLNYPVYTNVTSIENSSHAVDFLRLLLALAFYKGFETNGTDLSSRESPQFKKVMCRIISAIGI